jgi:hypothetical protein
MATQYTSILKLALPVQGELSGTWGDVVNDNITSMVEEAIAGRAVINTWTANSHTLTTADGTTSESRAAILTLTDTGTALTGAGTVICPAASKIYIVENGTGQTITVKTSSGTGVAVPNTKNMVVFCDGTNVEEGITNINSLTLNGDGATVSSIKDEDNMASDSATALATQQSIKAYVDSQVGANNELSEVLANGNTTGGTDISVSSGDDITFADNSKTIFGAGSDLSVYSDGSDGILAATANLTLDVAGDINLDADGADINLKDGGTRFGILYNSSSDFLIEASVQDKDIKFLGNDGGSGITALRLDMSEAGAATFNSTIALGDNKQIFLGDGNDGRISFDGTNTLNITASNGTATTLSLTANNFTIGGASALISGTANTSVVINEASGDVDFRAESNDNTHMLFVDAGNNRVGIGNSSPTTTLDVTGVVKAAGTVLSTSAALANSTSAGGFGFASNNTAFYSFGADASTAGSYTFQNLSNDASINITAMSIDASGNVGIGTSPAQKLHVSSLSAVVGLLESTGSSAARLYFDNTGMSTAGDAQIWSQNNDLVLNASGSERMRVSSAGIDVTGNATITTADNSDTLTLISTDADASAGPNLKMYRNSASPADSDELGNILFQGRNDNSQDVVYATIETFALDVSDGTEDAVLNFNVMKAGSSVSFFKGNNTEVVVNDDSNDLDFRVESNGSTHMLFVDAGNNRIGINDTSPDFKLDLLGGNGDQFRLNNSGERFTQMYWATNNAAKGAIWIDSTDSKFEFYGYSGYGAAIHSNATQRAYFHPTSEVVFNELGNDYDFRVESDGVSHALFVDASTDKIGIGESAPATYLDIGFTSLDQTDGIQIHNKQFGGYGGAVEWISRTAASLGGGSDRIAGQIQVAGANNWASDDNVESLMKFSLVEDNTLRNTLELNPTSEVVINQDSIDMDFRVESNNNANMLRVDAGTDRVAVKLSTAEPENTLDVNGDISFTRTVSKKVSTGSANANYFVIYEKDFETSAFTTNQHWVRITGAGSTNGQHASAEFYVTFKQQGTGKFFNIVPIENTALTIGYTYDASGGESSAGKLKIYASSEAGFYTYIQVFATARDGNSDDAIARGTFPMTDTGSGTAPAGMTTMAFPLNYGANKYQLSGYSSSQYVINENSYDLDFRVESDGLSHALFVDAGSNQVIIGDGTAIGSALFAQRFSSNNTYTTTNDTRYATGKQVIYNESNTTDTFSGITLLTGSTSGGTVELNAVRTSTALQSDFVIKSRNADGASSEKLRLTGHGGNLLFNQDTVIGANTSDASDNQALYLCGGGNQTVGRGANIRVHGNEDSPAGDALIYSGNVANSEIQLRAYTNTSAIRQFVSETDRLSLHNDRAVFNDDSGDIDFRVESNNNANMLFVDAGNDAVVIGDSDGSHTADQLQIETPASGGGHGIQIRRNDSNNSQAVGRIMFGNNSDADLVSVAAVTYGEVDSAYLNISTASSGTTTQRLRVDADGLKFGTDTAAASALNDYEEGTFTATLTPGTSGSIILLSTEDKLAYTKVGRLVTVTGRLRVSSVSSPVGTLVNLTSLPFVIASDSENCFQPGCSNIFTTDGSNTFSSMPCTGAEGGSTLFLYGLTVADIDNLYRFEFSFSYFTT